MLNSNFAAERARGHVRRLCVGALYARLPRIQLAHGVSRNSRKFFEELPSLSILHSENLSHAPPTSTDCSSVYANSFSLRAILLKLNPDQVRFRYLIKCKANVKKTP